MAVFFKFIASPRRLSAAIRDELRTTTQTSSRTRFLRGRPREAFFCVGKKFDLSDLRVAVSVLVLDRLWLLASAENDGRKKLMASGIAPLSICQK
jgi:hypothetical protein